MDMNEKLNIKLIKEELIGILESGTVEDAQAQYLLINKALREINFIKDPIINNTIRKYFEDQELLQKKIDEKQKELQKLVDEYSDNVKNIYENTIKKL